jgi:hypothetical protein
VLLLPVLDGQQGLVDEGRHLRAEVGLGLASAVPDASSGVTISLRHHPVSVSAMRRRLSP